MDFIRLNPALRWAHRSYNRQRDPYEHVTLEEFARMRNSDGPPPEHVQPARVMAKKMDHARAVAESVQTQFPYVSGWGFLPADAFGPYTSVSRAAGAIGDVLRYSALRGEAMRSGDLDGAVREAFSRYQRAVDGRFVQAGLWGPQMVEAGVKAADWLAGIHNQLTHLAPEQPVLWADNGFHTPGESPDSGS